MELSELTVPSLPITVDVTNASARPALIQISLMRGSAD
jgi:hypothetical protein